MKIVIPLTPPMDTSMGASELGFNAVALGIENPTPFYWYLPDELRFISPYTTGVIVPLEGVTAARILFQAPPGLQQPTIAANVPPGVANFTYYDTPQPPDSGVSLSGSTFGRNVVMRSITVAPGSTTFTDFFTVPAPDGFGFFGIGGISAILGSALFISLFYPGPAGAFGNVITINNYLPNPDGQPHPMLRYRAPIPALTRLQIFWNGAQSFPAMLVR